MNDPDQTKRRAALEELSKPELIQIVLRLQAQIRSSRIEARFAIEDGIAAEKSRQIGVRSPASED